MYIPASFKAENPESIRTFMARYSFATVVTPGEPVQVTHCPVLVRDDTEGPVLEIHFARPNPHCRAIEAGAATLAIFTGPHGYISPRWYRKLPAVPTWNYGAVHVHGTPRVVEDPRAIRDYFARLVSKYEGAGGLPEGIMPGSLVDQLQAGILLFELRSLSIEGKFKLGQNRSVEDQRSMRENLEAAGDAASRELASFMREFAALPGDAP